MTIQTPEGKFNAKEIMNHFEGDEKFFNLVLEIFLEEIPNKINKLKEALLIKDFKEISTIAHALKGNAGFIGFKFLQDITLQLEKAAKSDDEKSVPGLIAQFENEFLTVKTIIIDNIDRPHHESDTITVSEKAISGEFQSELLDIFIAEASSLIENVKVDSEFIVRKVQDLTESAIMFGLDIYRNVLSEIETAGKNNQFDKAWMLYEDFIQELKLHKLNKSEKK